MGRFWFFFRIAYVGESSLMQRSIDLATPAAPSSSARRTRQPAHPGSTGGATRAQSRRIPPVWAVSVHAGRASARFPRAARRRADSTSESRRVVWFAEREGPETPRGARGVKSAGPCITGLWSLLQKKSGVRKGKRVCAKPANLASRRVGGLRCGGRTRGRRG